MASVAERGNRKRSLNAEINLVPFIDLLTVSICFLLMTAVWIQFGGLPVKQSRATAAPIAKPGVELQLKFEGPTLLTLAAKDGDQATSYRLKATSRAEMLAQLNSLLRKLQTASPGAKTPPVVDMALITPNATVSYGTLVAVMDVLRKNQIFNLGVSASAE